MLLGLFLISLAGASTTFSSAISGATWTNDGIDLTLTENTDYNITGTTFKVADQDLAWTQVELSYDYLSDRTTAADYSLAISAEAGLGELGNWFGIIIIVGIAGAIITILFVAFGNTGRGGVDY